MARYQRREAFAERPRRDSGIQERRADRERAQMTELDARLTALLDQLKERAALAGWSKEGRAPAAPGISSAFVVERGGKTRRFICTYDQRLARIVVAAPRKAGAAPEERAAAILVTHEMRIERIAERILALFKN